jgi:hypothetical protein
MLWTGFILSLLATTAPAPTPPRQTASALRAADQARIVCVPSRTRAGRPDGKQVCLTGREWEDALAKIRPAQWTPPSDYGATPTAFRLNPLNPSSRR